jgi:serine/threonine-protein kinase
MTLAPGTRLGPYEVVAQIGAGGMGEVYRATDTDLGRAVAIKVLPDAFAQEPDRLARFEREARTLAALNHPHIAQIHGLERSGGTIALVMELVEGPTLADRIAQGAIPIDEALPIAKQLAEALEAAHEQGIIHRDLKPANIKVRPDGTVKVLDFGLAKATEPVGPSPSVSQLATVTSPALMTGVDVILGTAAYMSPEQARGKPVDRRADIWAFGCVLFEMLTGKRAFEGADVSITLASVLMREPEWGALPADLPAALDTYLRRCLHKDARQRVQAIGDVRLALEGAFDTSDPSSISVVPTRFRRVALMAAGGILGAVFASTAAWLAGGAVEPMPPRVSRLPLVDAAPQETEGVALTLDYNDHALAITPDASRVVFVGNKRSQIFLRALDALEAVPVFSGAPRGLFVAPDGQWIGFIDGNVTLKKVSVTGGPATALATLDGPSRGATWGPDDTIIVATNNPATGLQRVSAAGGSLTVLTRPDPAQSEADHLWPEVLPGGHAVLFTITALTGGRTEAVSQVAVLDLQTGKYKILVRGGSHAHYVTSGHLAYMAAGVMRAVPFDLTSLEVRGTSVATIPDVLPLNFGGSQTAVGAGTLAYVSGRSRSDEGKSTLVWVDRQGQESPISAPVRDYRYPRISPDGTRVALFANDQEADLWVWDFERTTLTRVTSDVGIDNEQAWTPDGRRLIFRSQRAGLQNLFWQAADGVGPVEQLTTGHDNPAEPTVSPDGRMIFTAGEDLMQMTLDGSNLVTPLVQSQFSERNGVVSPDGRWLAYQSNESGRFEIYVRPFPNVNTGNWQVSTLGGEQPLWAPSGRELFYASPAGALMRVGVGSGVSWTATTPEVRLKQDSGYYLTGSYPGRKYDVAGDGQRLLMIKRVATPADETSRRQVVVVQNWGEELKRIVPTD